MKGVNKMAKFEITAMYEYSGVIEANSEEEAERIFLEGLNDYYVSTDSFDIEEVEDDEDDENLEIMLHDAELEDEDI